MKVWRWIGWALVLALVACGGQATDLPWQEDFSEPGTWVVESDATAQVEIAEGVLRVHVAVPGQLAWAAAGKDLSDVHLAVEATQVAGPDDNEYGILLRLKDASNFYRFSISGDGYYAISKFEDGVPEDIVNWTPSEAIQQGQASNLIEVIAVGDQFTFRVNGQELAQVEDDTFSRGDVGLYAGTFYEGGVEILFDSLLVEAP